MGTLISLTAFVLFYLMTVFALSWGTSKLGYTREEFLLIQLFGILFFALTIPWSAKLAERGRRPMLMTVNVAICVVRPAHANHVRDGCDRDDLRNGAGHVVDRTRLRAARDRALRAFPDRRPLHGQLADVQPGGIFGASLTPYAATWLATTYGLQAVGYYLSAATVLSLIGLALARETKDKPLSSYIQEPAGG